MDSASPEWMNRPRTGEPQEVIAEPHRQQQALAVMTERLTAFPEVLGAILVGSLAMDTAEACSDIDLVICSPDGQFAAAWSRRHDVHLTDAIVCWDEGPDVGAEIAIHRWVTPDMVLVEALFASPGSGVRLATLWRAVAGDPGAASLFAPRPPIDRAEFDQDAAHPVDRAFDDLKRALHSLGDSLS